MFDAEPDGWEQTTLGAVATLAGGTTPSKSEEGYWTDGSIPWATPSDITSLPNGKARISATEVSVTDRALKECSLTLNPPSTVLMTSRATIGYAALNDVPMATNQGFITFRCGERTDPEFLLHWLTAKRDFLVAAAGGSTFKELSRGTAKLLPILLPPLDEQRRIAEVLRSVDDAIAASEDVGEHHRALKTHLAVFAFSHGLRGAETCETEIGPIPAHWRFARLEEVTHNVGVGIASSATHAYVAAGTPLLRNQNIKAGHLDLSDLLYVSDDYDASYASKRVKTGDVITMRTGYPGASAVIPDELNGCQTFTTLISRPDQRIIQPRFLCEWINSPTGMREVSKRQAGGAQQNLNAGALKLLPVPVPPLEEQAEIAALLDSFPFNDGALATILAVRDSLRADLLSGRVRVPA